MANLEWLCLLRSAMYWDAHACNYVADSSTEYRVHLPYSEWRVAGCAFAYRVVTSLPLKNYCRCRVTRSFRADPQPQDIHMSNSNQRHIIAISQNNDTVLEE